jgi:hypothetical protein
VPLNVAANFTRPPVHECGMDYRLLDKYVGYYYD